MSRHAKKVYLTMEVINYDTPNKFTFLCCPLVSLFTLGCGSETESKTLADFENALEANGISYSNKEPKLPLLVRAVDGARYDLNGFGIGVFVYQFDLSNPESERWHNTLAKDGYGGIPCFANSNLIIATNGDHPDWDKILKAFNSL